MADTPVISSSRNSRQGKALAFAAAVAFLAVGCDRKEPESDAPAQSAVTLRERPRPTNPGSRRQGFTGRGGIEFRRGIFLQQPLDEDGLPPARRFGELPEDLKKDLESFIALAKTTPARDEALNLIDQARDLNSIEILSLIEILLKHPDRDVRGNALSLLEGIDNPKALGVIASGLSDSDVDIRLQAVEAIGRITSSESAPILQDAFADDDLSVRQLAFQAAQRLDDATRRSLVEKAIQSPYEDLAMAGICVLEAEPSKSTAPILMDALANPSEFVRERAHDILFMTFHEEFTTPTEAKDWWNTNHRRYDESLVLKDF